MKTSFISSIILASALFLTFSAAFAQQVVQGEQSYSLSGGDVRPGHIELCSAANNVITTGVFAIGSPTPFTNTANQPRIYLNTYNTTAPSPLSAVMKYSYVTASEDASKTINASRSYISRDVKVISDGYIVAGEVNDASLTPTRRAFLMKVDNTGAVVWFRHYYPAVANADEMSFDAVAPISNGVNGFVACGYRYDQAGKREVARIVKVTTTGVVSATKELSTSNSTLGSRFIDIVDMGNNVYGLTGSCNVGYNTANVKTASDVLMSIYNVGTGAISMASFSIPTSGQTGNVEEGRSIVKHGGRLAIVGKKYSENLNATTPLYTNQSILATSFNVVGTTVTVGGTWTNNSVLLDIAGSNTENPKDLLYSGTTPGVTGFWMTGLYANRAFLLNLDMTTGTTPGTAETYESSTTNLTGECLTKSTAGNLIFAGRSTFGGIQTADVVARIGGTTSTGIYCNADLKTVTSTPQSLIKATLPVTSPITQSETETHIAVNHGVAVAYPCPGVPSTLRTANENLEENIVLKDELNVFPNPFREKMTLQFTNRESTPFEINLYDLQGNLVHQQQGNTEARNPNVEIVFDTDPVELPDGMYFIEIKTPTKRIMHKVLKVE